MTAPAAGWGAWIPFTEGGQNYERRRNVGTGEVQVRLVGTTAVIPAKSTVRSKDGH